MGQPFVVENRAGADSLIASDFVAQSEPDGYTIYFISSAHTVNPSLYSKVNHDASRDFAAITMVGDVPSVIVLHPALPAKTMREFIDLAKRQKGGLQTGIGPVFPHIQAKKLRPIGVSVMKRSPMLPEASANHESAVPSYRII